MPEGTAEKLVKTVANLVKGEAIVKGKNVEVECEEAQLEGNEAAMRRIKVNGKELTVQKK